MINQKQYRLKSLDGKSLFVQSWSNGQTPQALVCLVHNIGDHSGKFDDWAKLFVMNGIAVTALDLRGNGKSQGKRGHAKSYDELVNDLHLFIKRSVKTYPHLPVFIYGHGLGGTLALYYTIKKNPKIQGLITTSPWMEMLSVPTLAKGWTGRFLRFVFPKFPIFLNTSQYLNKNTEGQEGRLIDMLTHNRVSVKLLMETIEKGKWVLTNLFKVHHPLMILFGKEDKVCSYRSCKRYVYNTSESTMLEVLKDCSHDIHYSPNYIKINKEIVHWIRENSIIANTNVTTDELIPN